ncbi:serine/threonine protein kinase [Plakobranchus ocellatus]|uniref:non-specific serine/threonine protein kinase n=1 Tax=Plakobranchus ocellatus TaxID=259542 RepID=A0AAV3YMB3_9GAST|nr:serine/threonine protein kinase [Plakobranchus ocellatus]
MESFEILECISKGSPGTVYIVQSKEDQQKYALKKVECNDESDAINAFMEEMELKKMDHPYVVGYKDFFISYEKEASSVFINIISQYFEQGDLRKLITEYQERKEAIPEDVIKKILGEIFEGVVYIHEKGIIHRNIKPSNIFKKDSGAFVLGDLGVSTLMGDMRTNTRQTYSGVVYMAPEISYQPHDEKSDLYSLGGVLLNMLTTHLFKEEEFYKKLGEMKEDPEVLNEILEELSEKFSKSMIGIVQTLLRIKHSARPPTFQLIKSGFIQECMAQVDSKQLDKRSRQKETGATKKYSLTDNKSDTQTVLEYIADTIDHEACVAEGLSALADIVRDNESAHMMIDQKARNLISLAMWDNIFNKDVQISGCYVLSNLVVFGKLNCSVLILM